jgi:hypothetical protein
MGMFVGIHAMLAVRTGVPEVEITPDEGAQFMKAVQNVMRHYSVKTTQKTMDFVALFGVAAAIYGPRVAAYKFRTDAEKEEKRRQPNASNVVNGAFGDIQPARF